MKKKELNLPEETETELKDEDEEIPENPISGDFVHDIRMDVAHMTNKPSKLLIAIRNDEERGENLPNVSISEDHMTVTQQKRGLNTKTMFEAMTKVALFEPEYNSGIQSLLTNCDFTEDREAHVLINFPFSTVAGPKLLKNKKWLFYCFTEKVHIAATMVEEDFDV